MRLLLTAKELSAFVFQARLRFIARFPLFCLSRPRQYVHPTRLCSFQPYVDMRVQGYQETIRGPVVEDFDTPRVLHMVEERHPFVYQGYWCFIDFSQ